ncbi:hypothetical protein MB02_16295 [Croceicoccus estronivorus]|nr:hypothetical protein MB02_16295 [Croceicoccus estronivorus]
MASAPAAAQSQQEKLQSMAQFYAVSTYALGANENCDLLTNGEYRALIVMRDFLGREIKLHASEQALASVDNFAKGQDGWKRCLSRTKSSGEWANIDQALLIAHALEAAPNAMVADPATCDVTSAFVKLRRSEWKMAAVVHNDKYNEEPKKAQYDGLKAMFAGLIDAECARTGRSELMQAGFDALLLVEDINLLLQKNLAKKNVFTSVGSSLITSHVSKDLGVWRLRRGAFTGTYWRAGLNVYRVLKRGDEKTIFLHLTSPGTFGATGRMFITQKGRWIAEISSNLDAMEMRLSNGDNLVMEKETGNGSGAIGFSRFVLPVLAQARLDAAPVDLTLTFAYRVNDKPWSLFRDTGREADVQQVKLRQTREALAWATVPRGG